MISVPELLYSAQVIYARNFETIPLLMVASIWYIVVTSILSVGQFYLERHYAKGGHAQPAADPVATTQTLRAGPRPADRQGSQEMSATTMETAATATAPGPMIKADAVRKSYGHLEVLKGIDLQVGPARSCA